MSCTHCERHPVLRKLCKDCFCTWFEKKARKELRELDLKKDARIHLRNTNDTNYAVACEVLNKKSHLPLTMSEEGTEIVPSSQEDEARELMINFFENKKDDSPELRFFSSFEQKEIDLYAQLKNLSAAPRTHHDAVSQFIAQLNERTHNTTSSLAKIRGGLKGL